MSSDTNFKSEQTEDTSSVTAVDPVLRAHEEEVPVNNELAADDEEKSDLVNSDETADSVAKDEDDNGWVLVLGHNQLKKRTIKPGEDDHRPVKGQTVTIRCVGHLDDGTEVDKYDSLKIVIGDDDFIQAFDLCISLMELNEICEIMTEARFAYGEIGREPDVPPNAKILYEVELLDISDESQFHTLTINYRLQLSNTKRERGNFLYSRGEFSRAVDVYVKAMKVVDNENEPIIESADDLKALTDMRIKCCNNLAAAQLKLEAWDAAIKSCDSVLSVQPVNVKALFRKGKCLAGKGNYDDAILILTKALEVEPESKIIQQELARITKINRDQNRSQREMYQKMMGTDKEPFIKKQPSVKPADRRWIWYVVGAVASMAIPLTLTLFKYINGDESFGFFPATSLDSSRESLPTSTSVFE